MFVFVDWVTNEIFSFSFILNAKRKNMSQTENINNSERRNFESCAWNLWATWLEYMDHDLNRSVKCHLVRLPRGRNISLFSRRRDSTMRFRGNSANFPINGNRLTDARRDCIILKCHGFVALPRATVTGFHWTAFTYCSYNLTCRGNKKYKTNSWLRKSR